MELFTLENLSRLLYAVYRAGASVPHHRFYGVMVELLQREIPFDEIAWGFCGDAQNGNREARPYNFHVSTFSPIRMHQLSTEISAAIQSCKTSSTQPRAIDRLPRATAPSSLSFEGRKHPQRKFASVATYDVQTHIHFFICLFRATPLRDEEILLLRSVFEHLVEACRLNRKQHMSEILQSHSRFDMAAALTDPRGTILSATPQFFALLAEEYASWTPPFLPFDLVHAASTPGSRIFGSRITLDVHIAGVHSLLGWKARKRTFVDDLSAREIAVAQDYAQGRSHKQIAQMLKISPATVRTHVSSVYSKLHVNDKLSLAKALSQVGL